MSDLTIPLKVVDNGDGTYSITSVINAALPAGDNTIGKVGINQIVDGVTNRVVAKISQAANENKVEITNLDIALSALRDAVTKTGETSKTLADLAAQLGEVQENPTANTLLARLKSIEDQLTSIINGSTPAQTSIVGSLANNQTNVAVTANTNILVSNYTAAAYKKSILQIMINTSGVLSLIVDGVSGIIGSGEPLIANAWYEFDISLLSGSTYNLKLSVNATMQIKWQVI